MLKPEISIKFGNYDLIETCKEKNMYLFFIIGVILFLAGGWILNIENLIVCFPEIIAENMTVGSLSVKAAVSMIGFFVFPVGVVSGYIW